MGQKWMHGRIFGQVKSDATVKLQELVWANCVRFDPDDYWSSAANQIELTLKAIYRNYCCWI